MLGLEFLILEEKLCILESAVPQMQEVLLDEEW